MSNRTVFNPVKEEKDGVRARRAIWSTASFDLALAALKKGKRLLANPFYDGNTKLLKADLAFQRTPEEIEEWKLCKNSIVYFVETYCSIMTPQGVQRVKLRDYQKRYLEHLENNRMSIMLTPRQSGKCFSMLTTLYIRGRIVGELKNKLKKCYYDSQLQCYKLPFFELYNMYDRSFTWKICYQIYKLILRTGQKSLYRIISLLDRKNRSTSKLVNGFSLNNIEILTPHGWSRATNIYLTRPFERYTIITNSGKKIDCADDHILFSNGAEILARDLYMGMPIDTIDGKEYVTEINIDYNRVSMGDITVENPSHTLYTNGIKSHNTITSSLFMLHFICFNVDKAALIVANKFKTAKEVLKKAKDIYMELPFFLKPGILKWNEAEIAMDNGCLINAETTTVNSGIGFTYHCVLADEFAHVPPSIAEEFYGNLFPVISASNARFMITSTQNGRNLFYRLYQGAAQHLNDYVPFTVTWKDVPNWNPNTQQWEKRDEKWHRRQVANLGSEEAFNKQFGINFDLGSNTLISQKKINSTNIVKFIQKDLPGIIGFESWWWDPDYDPITQLRKDYLVITIDIGEQVGQDPTVFSIYKMTDPGTDNLKLVGYYRNSSADRTFTALSLIMLSTRYMTQEHTLISFELNTYGEIFQEKLLQQEEKFPVWDRNTLVKYYNESGTKWKWGIKITSGNKSTHCILFKEDYEAGKISAEAEQFVFEMQNFVDDGTGHYAACYGHDDMIMTAVQLEFVKKTLQYKLLRDEFNSGMSDNSQQDTIWNPYDTSGVPKEVSMNPFGGNNITSSFSQGYDSMPEEMIGNRRRLR